MNILPYFIYHGSAIRDQRFIVGGHDSVSLKRGWNFLFVVTAVLHIEDVDPWEFLRIYMIIQNEHVRKDAHAHIHPPIHIHFQIRVLSMPHCMSNTDSPCISVLWVNRCLAIIIDTFRPWFLGLPRPLLPGIGRSATDLIQDAARCACRHLTCTHYMHPL